MKVSLEEKQKWSLDKKIQETNKRIIEWYEAWEGQVYVAFSGGKDSTVLLHLVRLIYPEVEAVYVNTGLEYPEINEFVNTIDNVVKLRLKKPFHKIIQEYGYPIVSKKVSQQLEILQNPNDKNTNIRRLFLTGIKKDGSKGSPFSTMSKKWNFLINAPFKISPKCCKYLKKDPFLNYNNKSNKVAIIGTMASDSYLRALTYKKQGGCFNWNGKRLTPLSFWMQKDIINYIKKNNLNYSKIYDMGYSRTGCMFCMFGIHMEKSPNRFQKMQINHPKQYNYCINKLGLKEVLDYIHVPYKIRTGFFNLQREPIKLFDRIK